MGFSTKLFSSVSAKSTLMGIMIAAGVLAFALTGVGRIGSGSLDGNVAAKVGGQIVTVRQLSEAVGQLDKQSGNDAERRAANIQNAMNQLIQERILIEEANRMGWGASDVEVAEWIKKIPAFQSKETKQFDKAVYQKFLKSGQMSELDLFRQGRDSVSSRKLITALSLPDFTPRTLANETSLRDGTEFTLEIAELVPNEEAIKTASGAEARKFAADPANEKRLKDSFEQSKTEFVRKAQVRLKSILVGFKEANRAQGDALKRNETEASKLATDLHTRISKGEDFAKIASQINDDAAAKSAQGDIGFIDDSLVDTDTAKGAFLLNASAPLSGVIKTPFGFRILKFTESRAAVNKKFEEVKEELALRVVGVGTRQKFILDLEKEMSDALVAKNMTKVSELLTKNNLKWKALSKPVSVNTRFIEELGLSDPLLKHVFTLRKSGDFVTQVLDFSGRKAIFKLLARKEGTKPDAKKADENLKMENFKLAQSFVTQTQRKLFDVYTRDKQITRNMSLLEK